MMAWRPMAPCGPVPYNASFDVPVFRANPRRPLHRTRRCRAAVGADSPMPPMVVLIIPAKTLPFFGPCKRDHLRGRQEVSKDFAFLQARGPCYGSARRASQLCLGPPDFVIGKELFTQGEDICLLSTGNTLPWRGGCRTPGWPICQIGRFHAVKPLDTALRPRVWTMAGSDRRRTRRAGGLGGGIAEWICLISLRSKLRCTDRYGRRILHVAVSRKCSLNIWIDARGDHSPNRTVFLTASR